MGEVLHGKAGVSAFAFHFKPELFGFGFGESVGLPDDPGYLSAVSRSTHHWEARFPGRPFEFDGNVARARHAESVEAADPDSAGPIRSHGPPPSPNEL